MTKITENKNGNGTGIKWIDILIKLVKELGFPIFVALYLLLYHNIKIDTVIEELRELNFNFIKYKKSKLEKELENKWQDTTNIRDITITKEGEKK
jgi:hypothetical protein